MDEDLTLETRFARLEVLVPQLVAMVKHLTMRLETAVSTPTSALKGERANRNVAIDARLAVQARRMHYIEHHNQRHIQDVLKIPQSKLRGVLGWSEGYFFSFLNQHGLVDFYNTGV